MINQIEKGLLEYFFFFIYYSQAHLPSALQDSANLMPGTWFYPKLKFSLEILKRLRYKGIS